MSPCSLRRRRGDAPRAAPDAKEPIACRLAGALAPTCTTGALAFLGAMVWRAKGEPLGWDEPGRAALVTLMGTSPPLGAWSALGDARLLGLVCAIATLVGLAGGRARAGVIVWCAGLAALSSSFFLKAMLDRPRPPGACEAGASFPSTHAAMAAAVWLTLALAATRGSPRLRAPIVAGAFCAAFMAAAAGVASGRHWPSDALGGVLLGVAVAGLAARAIDRQPRP
ncbi:phosphatase PAP2 family protein [Caulobacter sp. 73W]|uniref:Phosphatase PAP2 family protein n=1 Tax=Caulobacter sp. 73W TaxID=3161137 RepID=A0AB39KRK1_9CAUL